MLDRLLALARLESDPRDKLHVPEPQLVHYGCTPWVPERDIDYRAQNPKTGAWAVPKRNYEGKDTCRWCGGNPSVRGHMCPGCHKFASYSDEDKLKKQRLRSEKYLENETPLERPADGPSQAP